MAFRLEARDRKLLAVALFVAGLAAIAALSLSLDVFLLLAALGSQARLGWVLLATGTIVALQLYALSQVAGWVLTGLPASANEPLPPRKRAATIAGGIVWLLAGVFQLWRIMFLHEASVTTIFGIDLSPGSGLRLLPRPCLGAVRSHLSRTSCRGRLQATAACSADRPIWDVRFRP